MHGRKVPYRDYPDTVDQAVDNARIGGMQNYEWASMHDAPVRELFPGIRLRTLWSGDIAKAFVLQMDPGTCWEGIDVHDPGPEEVFVVDRVVQRRCP
jgi:hypothetical protein